MKYTPATVKKVITLLDKGFSYEEISKKTGMSTYSINYYKSRKRKTKRAFKQANNGRVPSLVPINVKLRTGEPLIREAIRSLRHTLKTLRALM